MKDHDYLACDGGPHLVLPAEVGSDWKGGTSLVNPLDPKTDSGRAYAAIAKLESAVIPVAKTQALVLQDPPLSAWGKSSDGLIDVYVLEELPNTDLDALIKRAASVPTADLKNRGKAIELHSPDLILMFAGEEIGSTAYGQYRIPLAAGHYNILEGQHLASKEKVQIYRFVPAK